MSYDIYLVDPVTKQTLKTDVPYHSRGGIYAISGTTEMWLNITYNDAKWYYREDVFGKEGIRSLYGMSGAESIPVLDKAINGLLNAPDDFVEIDKNNVSYWTPTKENALRPLYQLKAMAKTRPDGMWDGD